MQQTSEWDTQQTENGHTAVDIKFLPHYSTLPLQTHIRVISAWCSEQSLEIAVHVMVSFTQPLTAKLKLTLFFVPVGQTLKLHPNNMSQEDTVS